MTRWVVLTLLACNNSEPSEQPAPDLARDTAACSTAPEPWRCLRDKSTTYMNTMDVKPAYELGRRAQDACLAAGKTRCESWEAIRLDIYLQKLKAGIDSGIDPRRDPAGFRRAGDAIRTIRLDPKSGDK
jgi:hypothetical protein